ncbi:hypothetical protein BDW75DRAFT_228646 [Aspergillus navahoensis]
MLFQLLSKAEKATQLQADSSNCPSNSTSSARPVPRPSNFHPVQKFHIAVAGTYFAFNSALGSSLTSGAQNAIADDFQVARGDIRVILPSSLYMAGFAIGPLIFGPLSEYLGRKPVLCATFATYMTFTMACAMANSLPALLVFRFFCGLGGSAPNAVLGGLLADIYDDPHQRGVAMSCFIFMAIFPSLLGPIISGFVSTTSWRWTFWAGLIIGTPGLPLLLTIPETYMPVLLQRNGETLGKAQSSTGSCNNCNFLSRPFIMFVREPIVFFCSIYLSMIYSLLYLFFESYPLVFQELYGMSPGVASLAFLPILPGLIVALIFFSAYSAYHGKALNMGSTWAEVEEYRRLPVACIGAPMIPIALFWFAAVASTLRSTFAVGLPLATSTMYTKLGINWASSLLGFISISMGVIPLVFIKYGAWMRKNSKLARRAALGQQCSDVSVQQA